MKDLKPVKKVLKNEKDLIDFGNKKFSDEHGEALLADNLPRPEHYPCMIYYGLYSDDGTLLRPEYISMKDFIQLELQKLDIQETGIVVMKFDDLSNIPETELEAVNDMLRKLGLSGMLMEKKDELYEFKLSHLHDIAQTLGFELKPKHSA